MQYKININLNNATYSVQEIVQILRKLADSVESTGELEHYLTDSRGNNAGESTAED